MRVRDAMLARFRSVRDPRWRAIRAEARDDGCEHALHSPRIRFGREWLLDRCAELIGLGPGIGCNSRPARTFEQREAELVPNHDATAVRHP